MLARRIGWVLLVLGALILLFLAINWYAIFLNVTVSRREFPLALAVTEFAVILLLFVLPGILLVRKR